MICLTEFVLARCELLGTLPFQVSLCKKEKKVVNLTKWEGCQLEMLECHSLPGGCFTDWLDLSTCVSLVPNASMINRTSVQSSVLAILNWGGGGGCACDTGVVLTQSPCEAKPYEAPKELEQSLSSGISNVYWGQNKPFISINCTPVDKARCFKMIYVYRPANFIFQEEK